MLHIVTEDNRKENASLLDQMHVLRAKQFKDRRGWRVVVDNGREKDHFDDIGCLYIIVSDGMGAHLASLRLLPTLGPHMLSDVFPEVMGHNLVIRHPLIWESSRFCVDTSAVPDHTPGGVNLVTRELLRGLFETAWNAGIINVVSVYDIFVERILKRAGCTFERIGEVVQYDEGLKTTAGLFEVSEDVILELTESPRIQAMRQTAA